MEIIDDNNFLLYIDFWHAYPLSPAARKGNSLHYNCHEDKYKLKKKNSFLIAFRGKFPFYMVIISVSFFCNLSSHSQLKEGSKQTQYSTPCGWRSMRLPQIRQFCQYCTRERPFIFKILVLQPTCWAWNQS